MKNIFKPHFADVPERGVCIRKFSLRYMQFVYLCNDLIWWRAPHKFCAFDAAQAMLFMALVRGGTPTPYASRLAPAWMHPDEPKRWLGTKAAEERVARKCGG